MNFTANSQTRDARCRGHESADYLIWIDSVDTLQQLYRSVLIPHEVRDELLAADAPAVVRSWASSLPDWIEVCSADPVLRDDPRWQFLDLGRGQRWLWRSHGSRRFS